MVDLVPTFGSIAVTITVVVIMTRLYPAQNTPQQPPSDDKNTSNDNRRCYGRFNHPNVLWIDKVISCLAALALGLNGDVSRESIGRVRKRITLIETIGYHVVCGLLDCIDFVRRLTTGCKRGNFVSSSKWVRGTLLVRRNSNILSDWGIDTNDGNRTEDDNDSGGGSDGHIRVSITCPPSAILWDQFHNNNKRNGFKDEQQQQQQLPPGIYLKDLPLSPSAHILFWFHGGAFVVGSPTDFFSIHAVREVMGLEEEALRKKTTKEEEDKYEDNSNNNDRVAPIVLLSIDYRLAPENPFPAAVIDCLSVVSLVLDGDENDSSGGKISKSCGDTERRTVSTLSSWPPSVHIGGISAGGNLACVVVFECLRRLSGRKAFKSALIIDPFIDPRTETPSYFHNARTSVISTSFLRSSWRAYLDNNNRYHDTIRERGEGSNPTGTISTTTTTVDVPVPTVADRSNKQQHQSEKGGKDNGMIRLYCPQLEPPPNVGDKNEAPLFLIHTEVGDPLRDEGLALVKSLRSGGGGSNGGNVVHLEARGSHAGGFLLDGQTRKKLMHLWHGAIYGKR